LLSIPIKGKAKVSKKLMIFAFPTIYTIFYQGPENCKNTDLPGSHNRILSVLMRVILKID